MAVEDIMELDAGPALAGPSTPYDQPERTPPLEDSQPPLAADGEQLDEDDDEDGEHEARTPPPAPNADLHHLSFPFEGFIASTLRLKLDNPASTICPTFLRTGACPRGVRCPRRHVPPPPAALGQRDPQRRTVCKHWLRGLCKKGENCDYLHEYDMRRMPECRFYASFGFCPSGDECLYLHVDPKAKVRECEHFRRGFCPKGPLCVKRHLKRAACPFYLAGFCPKGPECRNGHPKTFKPSPSSRRSSPLLTCKPLTLAEAFAPPSQRTDRNAAGGGGGHVSFGGGGLGTRPWQHSGGGGDDGGGGRRGAGLMHGEDGPSRPPPPRRDGGGPHGGPGGGGGREGGGGMRKDLSEVLCFKCGQTGHYANKCTNPNARGLRRDQHLARDRTQPQGPPGGGVGGGGGQPWG
ncbi:RNA-binding component of cleavage and polyadenylation factor [Tilletia horrida]|uniref:mRNA 3'-end-processing protein n=1 Tax=Tilletia horrida TaxID=155126 RepID=A0AAN6GHZ1_9BASI|nr:RNA-binding component of cleavage and polyadenylation factor [Tilletia horrida]KAK0538688.1 RNA-binding component of cleavage and polyadenylation factor [Tilletia horrida]